MSWVALALGALFSLSLPAQAPPEATSSQLPAPADDEVEKALKRFRGLTVRGQIKALKAVKAAVEAIDDPYLASIRQTIERLNEKSANEVNLREKQPSTSVRGDVSLWQAIAFPIRQEYVFGCECVVVREAVAVKRSNRSKREAEARVAELSALLHGFPPDLDLALASMLRDLDHDRNADAFSRVLETWRNGSESFYRALDRTAGTQGAVFFYDAMLDDFVTQCVPASLADHDRICHSTDAAHDALHKAFLAYRQYRGLREAAALALLLPPGAALPGPLARYEQDNPAGYSVRQVLALLLADADQDVGKVVAMIKSTAPAMPQDLWRGYQAVPAFYEVFNARMESMIDRAGHTDRLLEQQLAQRTALQVKIARAAHAALPRK